jgi:hypothetical protein
MGHKNDREIVGAELPAKPAVTRRNFLQGSASIAGGGLLLKDTFFSNILRALPPAASIRTQHRIAATPTHAYRPYRSKRATTADIPTWVQIDLGTLHLVEAVALYPANQRMKMGADAYYAGEAFPLRFKVEASKDSSFTLKIQRTPFSICPEPTSGLAMYGSPSPNLPNPNAAKKPPMRPKQTHPVLPQETTTSPYPKSLFSLQARTSL